MPGRPRKPGFEKYRIDATHHNASEFVHDLLVRELNAKLVPDSDKTAPLEWAPPLPEKEEKDMGLFDQYAAEGFDLGEIKLDPYAFEDGVYIGAFVGAEITEPANEEWDPGIQFDFIFISNADGSPTPLKDRRYQERMRYPVTVKSDDEDKERANKKALNRIAQRMHSLGVENPLQADVADINKLKGEKYVLKLNTPVPKQGQKTTQFFNILSRKKSDEEATKSFFDQE